MLTMAAKVNESGDDELDGGRAYRFGRYCEYQLNTKPANSGFFQNFRSNPELFCGLVKRLLKTRCNVIKQEMQSLIKLALSSANRFKAKFK